MQGRRITLLLGLVYLTSRTRTQMDNDLDKCADSTVCPPYAICISIPGNYTCVCKNGFVMGPTMECQDVDECSQNPLICGPNTKCTNVFGKYKCSCLSGFSSPRGNSWVPGKTGSFQCTDVDECADSTVCPPYAICINTPGNYTCDCKNGFVMGPRMECQDVDECSQNPLICGLNTKCTNVFGKYNCSCLSGFSSPKGNSWVPGKTGSFQCTDINECLRASVCPQHSTCQNTPGSYGCTCNAGFTFRNSQCEDVDECVDSTVCPPYAICINTPGNYTCDCKNGFVMGPRMECQDVDECSQNPLICGLNTKCTNVFGKYKCSCLSGFSSPKGNSWVPGKTGSFQCTDINECLRASVCPQHSTCQNTPGSYGCTCIAGFTFRNSQCEDVDECMDVTACPTHATCTNTLGNYFCTCKNGYKSSTSEVNFQGQGTYCEDLGDFQTYFRSSSRCLKLIICPGNSSCKETENDHYCICDPGFQLASGGHIFTDPKEKCEDVDECADSTVCPPYAICINNPGNYTCVCKNGFVMGPGMKCQDIDECMDATACPTHATCTNTLGNYFCTCKNGYKSSTSQVSFRGQGTQCKRLLVRCKEDLVDQEKVKHCQSNSTHSVLSEYISYCKLVDSILEDTCGNKTTNVSLKKAAENFASVLKETSTWHILRKEETSTLATAFLSSVENVILSAIVSLSGNTSQTVKNKYLEIESKVIQDHCPVEYLVLSAKGDSMKIHCSTINESVSMGTLSDITGIAFTSFVGMESILNEKFFYNSEANLIGSSQNLWMNSRVIGGIITGNKKENFSNPVIYTLDNLQPKKKSDRSICISWDPEIKGGRWTSTGCVMLSSTETQTTCSCNHLANMAVIMASGEVTVDFALFWISHVGMILSLLCLALAIITFLLCRSIWNHITTLHLHLCICLFLAKLLFLIGVARTENKIVCAVIAGLLHYLFLACFAWMLVEAMMLFLMVRNLKVVNYFSSRNIKMIYLYIFGYGLPGLIVLVSAGIQWEDYGMNDRCWLNTETGFIWSFLGPVCTIIMINSVLLTGTLWILRKKLSNVNADISTLKDNRLLTFKAFAQLFILGCSWILGIFQIGPIASTMAYLFTIINSLQGTFIFIIHCALNRQVREEYKRCFTGRTKASTTSQSSGILLSSMSSTSKTG
ncbi:adhesion G protein-coupled receptor E1-like isoform X3 [Macrotis lagotis]|uniref:adhesion G protein-coupled receptor E1-like isoform X3 n=1 Tax=Macrotis lagotis TaxID=92651 RepID=UPI003D68A11A